TWTGSLRSLRTRSSRIRRTATRRGSVPRRLRRATCYREIPWNARGRRVTARFASLAVTTTGVGVDPFVDGVRYAEAHLRYGGRRLLTGQGSDGLESGKPADRPWAARGHAEARPVPQRRPRHDEPVPARRGVRDRGRRRDRPGHRALRAVPRP